VSRAEADRAFNQAVPFSIRLCRTWFGLRSFEFLPLDGSPLKFGEGGKAETTVKVVADYSIGPLVLGRQRWQIEELDFVRKACAGPATITLIDVGANMGLFSRQVLVAVPAVSRVFAYEPEPENFGCLMHNLAPFGPRISMIMAAVSDAAGDADFYIDPTNAGNFSLAQGAMPPTPFNKIIVETRNVALESQLWAEEGNRIFYKSDTEGLDELVAASVPFEIWQQHVFAGLLEVWNIKKPSYDQKKFAAILNLFPNKTFLANADNKVAESSVTTADVLSYIASNNPQHRDLAFWK
jgi:FkbM family methyltransferase